jgi:hypothetical protein
MPPVRTASAPGRGAAGKQRHLPDARLPGLGQRARQVQPQHCRGCPFLMALAEFPDPAHPAHRAAVTMKAWVRDRLGQLTADLASADLANGGRATRPELLADQLSLIMEGTYASARALSAAGPARCARALAESLLDVS